MDQPLISDDFICEPTNSSKPYNDSIDFHSDYLEERDYSFHNSIVSNTNLNLPSGDQTTVPDFIGPIYEPLHTNRIHDVNENFNKLSVIHHSEDVTNHIAATKPKINYQNSSKYLRSSQANYNPITYPCSICGKFFSNTGRFNGRFKFIAHFKTHTKVQCPLCSASFPISDLFPHINRHVCKDNKTNITHCPICSIETKKMYTHLKTHIRSFDCPIPTCAQLIPFRSFKLHATQHAQQTVPQRANICKRKLNPRRRGKSKLGKTKYFDRTQVESVNHLTTVKETDIQIQLTNGNISQPGSSLPFMDSVESTKQKIPFSSPTEQNIVGNWEKHTKGIGMKLMNKMGYIPGQGLGVRGDGLLEPLEAVLLPRKIGLDTAMWIRKSCTLNGDKKTTQLQDTADRLEDRILDRSLAAKREELRDLLDIIQANEDYLKLVRNEINIETERLEKLAKSPKEPIEIVSSDEEMCDNSQFELHYSASDGSLDIVVISSDDEI